VASVSGGGYYIVTFGQSSAGKYLWTADFTTWTVTTSASGNDIAGMVWDGAQFLVARRNPSALRIFTDPALTTSWATQGVSPTTITTVTAFLMVGSRVLMIGRNGSSQGYRVRSDNGGSSWSGTTTTAGNWDDGATGSGLVLMTMNAGADGKIYQSIGGGGNPVTEAVAATATAESFQDVTFGNGRFTAVTPSKIYIDR
jgi:hypothetical protein